MVESTDFEGWERPVTRYTEAVRALAEDDVHTLLTVLPLPLPARDPASTERFELRRGLLPEPAIVAAVPGLIVHCEVVTCPQDDLSLYIMLCHVALRRVDPGANILQFLLVLRDDVDVPSGYDDPDGVLSARWTVIRVADLDPERLLESPTTAPLAALAAVR